MSDLAPIHREVVVDLDADRAFELFTVHIGDWWPLASHSVYGEGSSVELRDGEIVETAGEKTSRWGTITEWVPGERVAFTWHPGRASDKASVVSVSFTAQGAGTTLVVLEHAGWEVFDDPAAARSEYDHGWPIVLERYRQGAFGEEAGEYTWVALVHRPGPSAPAEGSIFDDPRFGAHVQFLSQMHQAGYLVAAGPMLDACGEGMTVLRLPGANRFDEANRLATIEDESVRGGFFEVSVRPWRVMMSR